MEAISLSEPTEHPYSGTKPVSGQHAFDLGQLQRYLSSRMEGWAGTTECVQFRGGQSNPTFLLSTDHKQYVLRRRPAGALLPHAHAIDREFRVTAALLPTVVPVARPLLYCDDPAVIGSAFYLTDYVAGRVFWDPALPGLTAPERGAIYDEANRVIAALHSIDPVSIGLADYGKSGNYFERQIARWSKQYRGSQTTDIAAMDHLMDWLPRHVPVDDECRIVHGDFRLDNMIFDPVEPRVLAVLDWELSTLGNPLADFAYHCLAWHLMPSELRGIAGADLEALGIPDEQTYLATYSRRVGRAAVGPTIWRFCVAFGLFKVAAILQGVMKRALEGSASNANALSAGARTGAVAERSWRVANGDSD
ncbi:MAG: phosphotransferase family protein [Microbacteriaceae bacterium]|nr:MAG: phosphotransferase family protein [Microbacteriaceae bacterium]